MNISSPGRFERAKKLPTANPLAGLYAALASARGEFPPIPRNRKATVKLKAGGGYSYNYADLADIFAAVTEPMAKHGLGVYQEARGNVVLTVIYHESGEVLESNFPIKPMPARDINDAQSHQSAFQVAKRYGLQAALGIATEESIEGDYSRRTDAPVQQIGDQGGADKFSMREAWECAILDKLPEDASDRQKAEAFAEAIMFEFTQKKSRAGLSGVWNKRERFIGALDAKHNDLFQSVFDAFHARMDAITEDEAEKKA